MSSEIRFDPATMPEPIAKAVNAIMGDVTYIQKTGENKFHQYKFTRVEDLLAKMQPAMKEHGLIIVQSEKEAKLTGSLLMVRYQFTLAHVSGATWAERPELSGMAAATNSKGGVDDKAFNKCFTAAGKFFLLGLFKIPTGLDPDEEEDRGDTRHDERQEPAGGHQQHKAKEGNGNGNGHHAQPERGEGGTFLLVNPNNTIASRHAGPGGFLQALEDAMVDGDDPGAWWTRNKALAEAIVADYPKARSRYTKLSEIAAEFTKEVH